MAASIPMCKMLIEKDIEKERKRSAKAAGLSFCLDHNTFQKFIKTSTNQELEIRNNELEARNKKLQEQLKHSKEYGYTSWRKLCAQECEIHKLIDLLEDKEGQHTIDGSNGHEA